MSEENCRYTISVFSENTPGVLNRITIIFTRRKINIDSLTVSETENKGISRFTIVVTCNEHMKQKLVRAINRTIEVVQVFSSENRDLIFQEIAFYRIKAETPDQRTKLEAIAEKHGARVAYAADEYLVIENAGSEDEIDTLYKMLEGYGILEFIRSGRIAIRKDM